MYHDVVKPGDTFPMMIAIWVNTSGPFGMAKLVRRARTLMELIKNAISQVGAVWVLFT